MIRLTLSNELLAADGIAIASRDRPGFGSEPASDFTDMTPIIAEENAP